MVTAFIRFDTIKWSDVKSINDIYLKPTYINEKFNFEKDSNKKLFDGKIIEIKPYKRSLHSNLNK